MVNQVHLPSSSASKTARSTISGTSLTWLLYSSCCNHMTSSPGVVPSHTSTSLPTIYIANGSLMHVSHRGNVSTLALSISNVYQIPILTHNLLSVEQLTELGFSLTFPLLVWLCRILRRDRSLGPPVRSEGCLSSFFFIYRPLVSLLLPSQDRSLLLLLYGILALVKHLSIGVKQLVSRGLIGLVSNKSFDYMPYQFGKQIALPFNNSVSHALSSFYLIHSDVWGPSPISTPHGSHYFVIFVVDCSRYTWIYLFKNHSKLYQIYRDFTKMIETQFSKPIKVFRSDNAQEYKAHEFTSILHQFGNVPHSSCAGTSQQNGRAKSKLCHILDVVCATTISASTPSQFWGGSCSYCRLHHQLVSFSHCSESNFL